MRRSDIPATFFVEWYQQHGKRYPWRDPGTSVYGLLIAELLLRQTRAPMIVPVWSELIARYPSFDELASASPDDVYRIVRPVGFGLQRTEALLRVAREIINVYGGRVPDTVEELERLPHIGPYIARAVCCFAFGRQLAVVDSNILRFFSRFFGCSLPRDIRKRGARCAWEIAAKLLPAGQAREHNYGLLDFTSDVCRPIRPRCVECPLAQRCELLNRCSQGGGRL